jgi:hypothetical protein
MIRAVGTIDTQDLMRKIRHSPMELLAQAGRPSGVASVLRRLRSVPPPEARMTQPDFAKAAPHVTSAELDLGQQSWQ